MGHHINGFPQTGTGYSPTNFNTGNSGNCAPACPPKTNKYHSLLKKIQLKSVKFNSHTGSLKSVKVKSVHGSNNCGITLGMLGLSNLKGVKSAKLSNIDLGSARFKSGCTSHGAYKSIKVGDLRIKSLKVQSGRIKSIKFASIKSNARVVTNNCG
jgi:hypothetical protein